jgi:FkbM family methyltransferase
VHILRRGTFDEHIWAAVAHEYCTLPQHFASGEVVLDVGCHIGAFAALAASRGATVVGYEANTRNHAIAEFNLAPYPSATVRHAAVWRSDVKDPEPLLFTPSIDTANTGGGSVLFASSEDHWRARPSEGADPAPPGAELTTHAVDAVPLDRVLDELGAVRFLKLDVEGAEFPILLTATRLDRVAAIAGEYHELTDDAMALLSSAARVGRERYTADLLARQLDDQGFEVTLAAPDCHGLGVFSAERIRPDGAR